MKVIELCPKLEDWLIEAAKPELLKEHNLPTLARDFHQVANRRTDNIKRLVAAMIKARNKAILDLQRLLTA